MKMLTKEVLEAFKKQGDTSQMKAEDIKIIVKFFNPCGAATWWCYEYDEKNGIFWCYANLGDSQMAECGTVGRDELFNIKVPPFGLGIERDMHFGNHTLKEVMEKI